MSRAPSFPIMSAISRARKATRFSLLLLEDGEVLLSDLAVQYRFVAQTQVGSALHPVSPYPDRFVARSAHSPIRGRIKIGTRNLFFDSDDWRDPVIRIPLASGNHARPTRDNSRSRYSEDSVDNPDSAEVSEDDDSVLVVATSVAYQRELGTDHPYIEVEVTGKHIFTPLYTSAHDLLDEINMLLRISSQSSRREREKHLRVLVQQREAQVPFDITLLQHGAREAAMMDSAASAVYAMSRAPGRFRITEHNVYFMPIHGESSQAAERISNESITSIRRLRHGCRDAALEVCYRIDQGATDDRTLSTLMVSFQSRLFRERAHSILLKVVKQEVQVFERRELEVVLSKWRSGQMSNFDYLMYLNLASGRSFNDMSQYPVFPWVLKNYDAEELDLANPASFRDLSTPIGALNNERLQVFKARYEEMPPPRFFYGTHYSTPAYTINYLLRAAPAAMLRLQNGRFDTPDRLFHSISSTWKGVLSNQGDVKELIPEFFALDYSKGDCSGIISKTSSPGEFLDNVLGLDLGTRQDGKRVDDVELPPWANGSSELFVRQNREALESDYVSSILHGWIDLIFGVKSRSAEAHNIFYTDVALPDSIDSEETLKLTEEEISQIETVYLEFGRTPERLFGHPHPPRFGDRRVEGREDHSELQNRIEPPRPSSGARILGSVLRSVGLEVKDGESEPSSSDSTKGALAKPKSIWGSGSRRKDSILEGSSDHILVLYEPPGLENEERNVQVIPETSLSHIISPTSISERDEVVDMCLVRGDVTCDANLSNSLSNVLADAPAICTIWADGYLKVHSEQRMLRSKHIGDACSVAYMAPGVVAYGNPNGSIGLYYIDSGRKEIAEEAAHDAEVCALEYVHKCKMLISGSKDASVKVWRVERPDHRTACLKLLQELDAESCTEDVSGTMEGLQNDDEVHEKAQLLVAASTTEGHLLAWEIDVCGSEQAFPEPVWRFEMEEKSGGSCWSRNRRRRRRGLTWLYQGKKRRHVIASVHDEENCLRVWKVNQEDMASAEVFLSEGAASCISSCDESRTVLVGGRDGRISEFDSTGLCLGGVVIGAKDVRSIFLPEDGDRMYVFSGRSEALRVNR